MAQRILEPGEIETLAQRSIPRVRLPERATLFARRAARLHQLSEGSGIGGYLNFLALVAEAQHIALAAISVAVPTLAQLKKSSDYGMPPIQATNWPLPEAWLETLRAICSAPSQHTEFPAGVGQVIERIQRAPRDWIYVQAAALLRGAGEEIDAAAAPLIMAALQVQWAALAASFNADEVMPLDVPGLCPLCGSLPVASLVCALPPYQGYRYLHCALCATEWHMVRVQCTRCGASGKSIAYQSATPGDNEENDGAAMAAAVRAETCEECHGYRKILYQEKDLLVEPVADDLASLSLDLLLAQAGYDRASNNPLLWQPGPT